MADSPLRTIVEGDDFRLRTHVAIPNPQLQDAILEGLYWTLARDPAGAGTQIRGTSLWAIDIEIPLFSTRARIYYTFDDDYVVLRRAREI